ncbi:3-hydroxyacyl-CoA dehydrogenase family protein [Terrimonas sp. NA20]|uniref:3-hydroxyacyl-CoA dehydrogenase family protein n=1 Tax=Terrimonas ginsenosidimutans TaxID=2908004 RepID=A0ABS9KNL3_9BACT|nr:3-hydroxyacyl-CoA dehydrogenase family protein [Terrimonas ginsenosidimutans]MCG2613925.1 3-hydroxyacyl-CoA dehydrogenase family protein [Terrimonas ginsenosidimutans]
MQIVVITNDTLKNELLAQTPENPAAFHFISHLDEWPDEMSPRICIDLLFDGSPERSAWLRQKNCRLTIVNSVLYTLNETDTQFVRVNAWTGFLQRNIVEAAVLDDNLHTEAEQLFSSIGKSMEWVPDICGFLSARVVATIVNEAFYSLEEEISSEKEIDTAMKLGTNYPFGPFEWAAKIGISNIHDLLKKLSFGELRYTPCKLLEKKALA